MDPNTPSGPPTREEFNRLQGQLLGMMNAVRALVAAAPDPAAALAAMESCFMTEEAMGQSAEYLDAWTGDGLQASLEQLKAPIRHDWTVDGDPGGLIAKAQDAFRERQNELNSKLTSALIEPGSSFDKDDAAG